MFVRFVVGVRDDRSDQEQGIFTALYDLQSRGELLPYECDWFRATEAWFNANLRGPDRLAWSSRPHAPNRAISWLKLTATDHVAKMRELAALLKHKDVLVRELRTDRPGYAVYEDEHQVAAIPFSQETFD
jgi:hypothetical protein